MFGPAVALAARVPAAALALALALAAAALAAAVLATPARAEVVWLCEPGAAGNPCEIPQDTTIQASGRPDRVVTPRPGPRRIDCFYVYPTVSNQQSGNADKSLDPELVSIAKYQAARFSQQCRVFAPIYRQITLAGLAGTSAPDGALAYADVLEAWREYLATRNRGRGVVLIGHSQGTFMLRRLVAGEIEAHAAQRRRLVGALLLGGDVTVASGRRLGGDFRRTPLCTREAQVGCVVAYSTFAEDPPGEPAFGAAGAGLEVACTDPRPLAGTGAALRLLVPSEPFAPGAIGVGTVATAGGLRPSAATTWVTSPDRYEGGCRRIGAAHVLRYDPVGDSRRPRSFPAPDWGTHLVDVNLTLDALVRLVARQAARWTRPRVRLARGCRAGRVRVRLRGRDVSFVRRVAFRAGGRRVVDRRRPFRAALSPAGARRVHAVVRLRHGEPRRLTLRGRLPRC